MENQITGIRKGSEILKEKNKSNSNMGTQLFFRSLIDVCRTSKYGCLVAVSKETCHFISILTDSNTCKQNQELHFLGYDY